MDYDLIATPPTLAEYLALRAKSGAGAGARLLSQRHERRWLRFIL